MRVIEVVQYQRGNFLTTRADALLLVIRPDGQTDDWSGPYVMQQYASRFHRDLRHLEPRDGATFLTTDYPHVPFRRVLFVVDELQRPLADLLQPVFALACSRGVGELSLTVPRMGRPRPGEDPYESLVETLALAQSQPGWRMSRVRVIVLENDDEVVARLQRAGERYLRRR